MPNKHEYGLTDGVLYNSMGEKYDFKKYVLNNPIIGHEEIKKLKTKCTMKLLTQEEINKINNSIIFNEVNFKPLEDNFLIEDHAQDKIDFCYRLENLCRSLTTQYIKHHIKVEAENNGVFSNYYCTKTIMNI